MQRFNLLLPSRLPTSTCSSHHLLILVFYGTRFVISGHLLCHEHEVQIQKLNTILRKAKNISEGQQLKMILFIHYCGAQARLSLVGFFFDELETVECFKNRANHVVWGFADDDIFELGELLMKRGGLLFQFLSLGITSQP